MLDFQLDSKLSFDQSTNNKISKAIKRKIRKFEPIYLTDHL